MMFNCCLSTIAFIVFFSIPSVEGTCQHTFGDCGAGCFNQDDEILNNGLRLCFPVGTGYYSPDNDNNRYFCRAGSFSSTEEASECMICPAGSISGSGQSDCFPCPSRSYQDSPGQTFCMGCVPGYTGMGSNDFTFDGTNILCALTGIPPSTMPSLSPTSHPSTIPTTAPSTVPSLTSSYLPTTYPSSAPSSMPSNVPSMAPSVAPTQATISVIVVVGIAALIFLIALCGLVAYCGCVGFVFGCVRRCRQEQDNNTDQQQTIDGQNIDGFVFAGEAVVVPANDTTVVKATVVSEKGEQSRDDIDKKKTTKESRMMNSKLSVPGATAVVESNDATTRQAQKINKKVERDELEMAEAGEAHELEMAEAGEARELEMAEAGEARVV